MTLLRDILESARFLRYAIDNLVDGFFAIDHDRRFVAVNDSLCRQFRATADDFIGHQPLEFVTEETQPRLVAKLASIELTKHREYQLVARRRDGSTFPMLLKTTTIVDDDGVPIGSFGFVTDISEVVAAQHAVAESEQELRRILDNMQETYYRTDLDGRLVRISKAGEALLGYAEAEAVGRMLADFYCDPAEREMFVDQLMANGGRIVGAESHLRRKDGTEIWVLTNAHCLTDEQGQVIGIEGTSRDHTTQRENEQRLRLAARVFQASGEGIVVTDADNRIVAVNQAFASITGYSADDVLGHNPRLLQSGRHDADFYRRMWDSVLFTGTWQGELWNRHKDGSHFAEWLSISVVRDGDGRVTHHVGIFSDITARKAAQAHIEFLAKYDALTHLPNRVVLRDRVEHAITRAERSQRMVAVMFIDLDRFKIVNDSLGHAAGDALLREVAQRVQAVVRESDTVSRTGGDEFLVALTDLDDAAQAARVAEKILQAMEPVALIDGHEVHVSCSIGVSLYPGDGQTFDDLVKQADLAMYHAKSSGRNAFCFHDESMTADVHEQMQLQGRLRRALDRGEFEIYYQPLVTLPAGRIVGAEALLRWRDPDHGLISPARFIPAAENSGLIVPIGDWVLRQACLDLAQWRARGGGELVVAVNLSVMQFRRGDIVASVMGALAASGLPADALELEITESVMLDGSGSVMEKLEHLRQAGASLSIDDFGTGYSSLAYLKRLKVHKLKIDQSFVRDLETDGDDAAIVRAIVQMARSLNLNVLAEGVESEAIADGLHRLQCDMAQGYHFGRPMPAADFCRHVGIAT